jgi:hypothetical protein
MRRHDWLTTTPDDRREEQGVPRAEIIQYTSQEMPKFNSISISG